jgi:HipA-like protein
MPTLRIKLGNRLVGTITNVVTDKNIFVFDPGYVEDERRAVLSLSYYDIERKLITRPREVQRRLPPFFSNLLPERDGVLRDYLAQRGGISGSSGLTCRVPSSPRTVKDNRCRRKRNRKRAKRTRKKCCDSLSPAFN